MKKIVLHLEAKGKCEMVAKSRSVKKKSLLPTIFSKVLRGFGKQAWQQELH